MHKVFSTTRESRRVSHNDNHALHQILSVDSHWSTTLVTPPASVPCGDVTVEPCMWIMPQRGVSFEQCIDKIIFVGTVQLN